MSILNFFSMFRSIAVLQDRQVADSLKALLGFVVLFIGAAEQSRGSGDANDGFNADTNGVVRQMLVQRNGDILVGGDFTQISGQPRGRIARLDNNGFLDPTFDPGASGTVSCFAEQVDGKVLVGGEFSLMGGYARSRLARILPSGAIDPMFNPIANDAVNSIAVLDDGSIIVGGDFAYIAGNFQGFIEKWGRKRSQARSVFIEAAGGRLIRG